MRETANKKLLKATKSPNLDVSTSMMQKLKLSILKNIIDVDESCEPKLRHLNRKINSNYTYVEERLYVKFYMYSVKYGFDEAKQQATTRRQAQTANIK